MNRPTGRSGDPEELPEVPPTAVAAHGEEVNAEAAASTANRHHAAASARATRSGNLKELPAPFTVNLKAAILSGVFATVVFTILWYPMVFIAGEDNLDLALILGAFITPKVDGLSRLLGLGIHIGIGTGIALSYAVLLYIFRLRSNAGKGAVFGFMVMVPMLAFFMPWYFGFLAKFGVSHASLPNPDVLLNQVGHSNYGWEVMCGALAAHLMYGAVLGALYREKPVELGTRYRVEYAGG